MRGRRDTLTDLGWPPTLALANRILGPALFGTRHVQIAQWLPRYRSWSDEGRSAWRQAQLARVLRHASEHVPYHRGRPADPRRLDRWPVVDKTVMREQTSSFTSTAPEPGRTITKRTGGSTGDPWIYPLDVRAFSAMYGAQLGFLELSGYRYGQRRLYLGAPTSLGLSEPSLVKRARLRLERNDPTLTSFEIGPGDSLTRVVRACDRRASLWYGYAGTVAAMAEMVVDTGIEVDGPPLIVTMAEQLTGAARATIERAFPATTVVEEYGCNDGGVLAHSCPEGLLHLADTVSVVEVLDGERVCQPGEEGEVTVTNLHALVMPFIRYQVGDRAVRGPDRCPCGRPGPTLAGVTGRSGDQVELGDGRALPTSAFTQVFKHTPDVRHWQLLQWSPEVVEVRLRVGPSFDPDQRSLVRRYVQRLLGDPVAVEVSTAQPLVRTPGGKHRVVVGAESLPDDPSRSRDPSRSPKENRRERTA